MSIIRRIRIGKLTGHYQEKDLEVMNFIQQVLDRMVMKTHKNYPNKIFYVIVGRSPLDDKVYFEMEKDEHKRKTDYLWCRYNDFWRVLQSKYVLYYTDIQSLIKSMFEQHIKQEVGTPMDTKINIII